MNCTEKANNILNIGDNRQIYSPKLHNIAKIGSEISSLDIICQTKLCLQFKVYSIVCDLDIYIYICIEIYARNQCCGSGV